MRIALAPSGPTGLRAGRVLLADRRVTAVGAFGTEVHSQDSRVQSIDSLDGWDMVVSDAAPDDERISAAITAGILLATPHTAPELSEIRENSPILTGASPASGLPAALAISAMSRLDRVENVSAAVTVPARRVPHQNAVSYPDPIGPLWSESTPAPSPTLRDLLFYHSPYDGPLAGITARAEGEVAGAPKIISYGIVDDPLFLGAIALAAAALMTRWVTTRRLPRSGDRTAPLPRGMHRGGNGNCLVQPGVVATS